MTNKLKRKLKDIDFQSSGSHVALTCKQQNGPANGHDYALLLKSSNRSPEFIQKASMVKVEMEITEYLRKFFNLYWDDAEVLARSLGFTTAEQDYEAKEAESEEEEEYSYTSWIDKKVASIQVIKSLKESDNLIKAVSVLSEDDYLSILKDQELVEKALKEYSPVTKSNKELETMPQAEVQEVKAEPVAELIAKSQFDLVQKALDEQKVELQKALELVEQFKQEKKEALTKARFEVLKAAVKDTAKAEVLFKALNLVEDETEFQAVVKAVGDLALQVEQSNLFSEQGVSGDAGESIEENPVAKILKAKYGQKQ